MSLIWLNLQTYPFSEILECEGNYGIENAVGHNREVEQRDCKSFDKSSIARRNIPIGMLEGLISLVLHKDSTGVVIGFFDECLDLGHFPAFRDIYYTTEHGLQGSLYDGPQKDSIHDLHQTLGSKEVHISERAEKRGDGGGQEVQLEK